MKKLCVVVILSVLVLFFSTNVKAENMQLFVNVGAITDDSLSFDPLLWFVGANIDFHLGDFLMLSPEANVVTYKFEFDTFLFQPAILLNIKLGTLFIGGGIQKYFLISGEGYAASDWGLKLNAGLISQHIRARVFLDMAFDDLFKHMQVGFQIGLGF